MRFALILAPMLLTGCATSPEQVAEREASQAAKVPAATPSGPPESCIITRNIRSTKVRNDSVIDFEMAGGKIYRNTLPQSCPNLGFEERFSYKTSVGQLCSVDTITVLRQGMNGPTCGLGQFQPVELTGN